MTIDPLNIGAIIIALIAALGAWASRKASTKATVINAKATAEVDAYNRARKMDLDTIKRQDEEFDELQEKYDGIKKRVGALEIENDDLRSEISQLRRRMSDSERRQEDNG